ncbi:MAG: hypothetical protein DSY83_15860, partial [Flavobacteriia bacterium]
MKKEILKIIEKNTLPFLVEIDEERSDEGVFVSINLPASDDTWYFGDKCIISSKEDLERFKEIVMAEQTEYGFCFGEPEYDDTLIISIYQTKKGKYFITYS